MDPIFWMFSTTHLVLMTIIVLSTIIYSGYQDLSIDDSIPIILVSIFVSLLFPMIVAMVVVASPFVGLYYLARWFGKRYNKK